MMNRVMQVVREGDDGLGLISGCYDDDGFISC
jgi:hypothetical protein